MSERKRTLEECLEIVLDETRRKNHGKGAWKVVQASLEIEKRIKALIEECAP